MKTSNELATSPLIGAAELKKSVTRIKRIAGGLRSEVACSSHELSAKETAVLQAATTLLDELARRYSSAAKTAQRRLDARAKAEKMVRAAMAGNFFTLSTTHDKVALVAAVRSYQLRSGTIKCLDDLDYYFSDVLQGLAYTLSGQVDGRTVEAVVADAWQKFQGAKDDLKLQHSSLIGRLVLEQARKDEATSVGHRPVR